MTTIDQLTTGVAGHLLRRGFVHDDPAAYRAGVRDAVAAIRQAVLEASEDGLGAESAEASTLLVGSPRTSEAAGRDVAPRTDVA